MIRCVCVCVWLCGFSLCYRRVYSNGPSEPTPFVEKISLCFFSFLKGFEFRSLYFLLHLLLSPHSIGFETQKVQSLISNFIHFPPRLKFQGVFLPAGEIELPTPFPPLIPFESIPVYQPVEYAIISLIIRRGRLSKTIFFPFLVGCLGSDRGKKHIIKGEETKSSKGFDNKRGGRTDGGNLWERVRTREHAERTGWLLPARVSSSSPSSDNIPRPPPPP